MESVKGLDGRRPRVLVVDDQPVNVMILNELLSPLYDVFVETKVARVVDVATQVVPDIILLDVVLNDIDGYEVCKRLKTTESVASIPVIFITAKSKDEDEEVGFSVGAVDYIAKPFNATIALTRIRTHITLKQQADHLESLARLDGLTGIPNRRAFDEALARSLAQACRDQIAMSVALLDVDFFKRFNDEYGHLEGDGCLKAIAETLSVLSSRPLDLAARFGGEEFACLLPQTSIDGAIQFAEKVRVAIKDLKIPHAGSDASDWVTVSIGLAEFNPQSKVSAEELLIVADEALYRAKENGRNQVAS